MLGCIHGNKQQCVCAVCVYRVAVVAWLLGIELIERHCIVMAVAGCQQLRAGSKSLPLLGSYVSSAPNCAVRHPTALRDSTRPQRDQSPRHQQQLAS